VKRYILWDNDGVLVDTEFWYFTATQRALAELGVTLQISPRKRASMPTGS
jgi:beta-phosphoglucomutase-like phosphatase (HAD superfamily)